MTLREDKQEPSELASIQTHFRSRSLTSFEGRSAFPLQAGLRGLPGNSTARFQAPGRAPNWGKNRGGGAPSPQPPRSAGLQPSNAMPPGGFQGLFSHAPRAAGLNLAKGASPGRLRFGFETMALSIVTSHSLSTIEFIIIHSFLPSLLRSFLFCSVSDVVDFLIPPDEP